MPKISVLVEGPTEQTFIREVLAPAIRREQPGKEIHAIILHTRRLASGEASRGGYTKYKKMKTQILDLLGDTSSALVTTMLDLYGLSSDFPGFAHSVALPGSARAQAIEDALSGDVAHQRFSPYLSTHEFEALIFSDIQIMADELGLDMGDLVALKHTAETYVNPEDINGKSPPSARIRQVLPEYDKPFYGSLVALAIGLPTLEKKCPRFGRWVAMLRALK